MKKYLKSCSLICLVACVLLSGCSLAEQQAFPNRNIKVIVPFNSGGGVDICCRIIGDVAGKDHFSNHSLVIENVPGGGAIIGQTRVANAKPDGYTLLAASSSIVTNPIFNKTNYTASSFTPIAMFCFDPQMIVVPADSPYKTIEDFLKAAKKKTMKMSTPGHTTGPHIAGLKMAKELELKIKYLHNSSSNEQFQQIMGSHVDCALVSAGEGAALVRDGSIRALAVMSEKRVEGLENVPTFLEKNISLLNGAFRGIVVPKDTPKDVVEYLQKEMEQILTSNDFKKAMVEANMPLTYKNAKEFQRVIDEYQETVLELSNQLK